MKIDRKSWHGRFWLWSNEDNLSPSVCEYWAHLIYMPLLIAAMSWLIPLAWISDKLESKCKGKGPSCPFGKIEFTDKDGSAK